MASERPATPQRRLRNYLIDWRLQLRYVLLVSIMSAAISTTLGYLVWKQATSATDKVIESFSMTARQADAAPEATPDAGPAAVAPLDAPPRVVLLSGDAGLPPDLLDGGSRVVSVQVTEARMEEPAPPAPVAPPPGDDLKEWIESSLQTSDRNMVIVMIGVGLGLIAVLVFFLIMMTHRVAGPLYKVGSYFDQIRDGQVPHLRDLRKHDQLQDFFQHFREMVEAVRGRAQRDLEVYDAFIAACEASGAGDQAELQASLEELRALRKRRAGSLQD